MSDENPQQPIPDPPLPKPEQFSAQDSWQLHQMIADATGAPNPLGSKSKEGPREVNFADFLKDMGDSGGVGSQSHLMLLRQQIDVLNEIKELLQNLPQTLQFVGGR